MKFTDKKLHLKGTCEVRLSDPFTGDIWYVSDEAQSGNVSISVNLNEIRAGLGNPIVAMLPSDSAMQVNFTMADFNLGVKAMQAGGMRAYSAPAPKCFTMTATATSLTINTANGMPVAALGMATPKAFVQEVGATSTIFEDGIAYDVNPESGVISDFVATVGKEYKITYMVENVAAEIVSIGSLLDPKIARYESKHAVFCNTTGPNTQGTRVGWLYVVIPFLKLQADASITGDQTTADTTIVSGQSIPGDSMVVSANCDDCTSSNLGYYIYVPDDGAANIKGLAVVGGVTSVEKSTAAQLPVVFVMGDGSTVKPTDTTTGFTYTLTGAPSGTNISTSGLITAGSTTGDCECETTYVSGSNTYTCVSNVSVIEGA